MKTSLLLIALCLVSMTVAACEGGAPGRPPQSPADIERAEPMPACIVDHSCGAP